MIKIREGLTFDDLLLIPKYSDINSRSEVNVSVELPKGFKSALPIIPANMATITGYKMAEAIYKLGGIALVHRFCSEDDQLDIIQSLAKEYGNNVFNKVGLSVGAKKSDQNTVDNFVDAGVKIICVDIAHAHSKMGNTICEYISDKYPEVLLIAGTVATSEGAKDLWRIGVDVVRVGIGGGSICLTRINTATGVPQLTAISDVAEVRDEIEKELGRKLMIISDGGCVNPGHVARALCFADMVIAGNMFAGTDEAEGKQETVDGKTYKAYNGSSTHKGDTYVEGVIAKVEAKGSVNETIRRILEGVRSACSYQGVRNLIDLKKNPEFVSITNAGIIESGAHNVVVVK